MVGRDALINTFGECVVAKANEADCGAQTPKWTCRRVRKEGVIEFREVTTILYKVEDYEHQHNAKTRVVKLQFAMQILFLSLAVGMPRDVFARNYERRYSA